MLTEIWRDIPEYEGLYAVSNYGRVKSYPRKCWNGSGFFVLKERIMKQQNNGNGYFQIMLNSGSEPRLFYVHRLVMLTFVGPANGMHVNHKNGVKHYNYVENLEYVTPTENSKHAWDNDLIKEDQKLNFIAASKRKRSEQARKNMSIAGKNAWIKRRGSK